jgi:hypothetical protein
LVPKELWCVPGPEPRVEVPPVLVATFENYILPVAEAEPDVFIIGLCDLYSTHESHLARVDLNGWTPGKPVTPEIIFTFDERARGLNGSCMLGPGVLLVADCFAGLIWRVDLANGAHDATARVWLSHDTMAFDPDSVVVEPPPQPGVNGVRYGAKTGYVYYTGTAQQVFMRVPVDQASLDPAGPPEFVAALDMHDDFCLDEDAGFASYTLSAVDPPAAVRAVTALIRAAGRSARSAQNPQRIVNGSASSSAADCVRAIASSPCLTPRLEVVS